MRDFHHKPLTLILALTMTSCGGDSGGTSGPQTPVTIPTPAPAVTPAPAPMPIAAPAPTPTPTPTSALTDGARRYPPVRRAAATVGLSLPIGRCMNVEYDDKWRRPVSDADYRWFRQSGFDTIRLPIRFAQFAGKTAPYTIDPAYLSEIRRVANVAVAADLNVIIDLHHYQDFFADPDGERPRFIALWKQIAEAFKGADKRVYFELLNEPQAPFTNAMLKRLYEEVIPVIRKDHPVRPIIISGQDQGITWPHRTFDMPNDPYIMPTFHTYDPSDFSFQGAPSYKNGSVPTGTTFGSDADIALLNAQLDRLRAFMTRTGTVPFIGEFGAYEGIPIEQRVKYLDLVSNSFASIGVSSCVWAYSSAFTLRDDAGWLPNIVSALAKPLD